MSKEEVQVQKKQVHEPDVVTEEESRTVYRPATDILARENGFMVTADMPGVDRKHVEVNVEDNTLTIRGVATLDEPEGTNLIYREFEPGVYERSFTLPAEIDVESIKAELKHGVLKVNLPRAPEAQPRRIEVVSQE